MDKHVGCFAVCALCHHPQKQPCWAVQCRVKFTKHFRGYKYSYQAWLKLSPDTKITFLLFWDMLDYSSHFQLSPFSIWPLLELLFLFLALLAERVQFTSVLSADWESETMACTLLSCCASKWIWTKNLFAFKNYTHKQNSILWRFEMVTVFSSGIVG